MDIGTEFEEDFFEKPKDKRSNEPPNYEAKFCVPLWFMDSSLAESESTDVLTALKHQADYYYFTKNYPKAIETYKRCLELVPSSNNTWKREFMENLARAFLQVDDAERALEWSLKLELEALHQCLEANKLCPEFWLRLGLCYAGLYKIYLPEYSMTALCEKLEACCAFKSKINSIKHPETQENNTPSPNLVCSPESAMTASESSSEAFSNKCYVCQYETFMVSSCLIHTRMLIDSGGPNHLAVERDERMKEKISNSLKHMEVNQSFIDTATKVRYILLNYLFLYIIFV
ncbi:UNVERIFIED_CONTAM: C8orf76 [Trichonephila clavipes]